MLNVQLPCAVIVDGIFRSVINKKKRWFLCLVPDMIQGETGLVLPWSMRACLPYSRASG